MQYEENNLFLNDQHHSNQSKGISITERQSGHKTNDNDL